MLHEGRIVLFLIERGVGLVNLLAFLSFLTQWRGLISSNGLSPLKLFQKKVLRACWGDNDRRTEESSARSWREWMAVFCTVPSLTWFCAEDWFLAGLIYLGIFSSLLTIINYYAKLSFLLCAVCYLSLKSVSEPFLSLQMDGNLIELDFLFWLGSLYDTFYPFVQIMTLRFHLFRIMVACGLVKIFGSPCWRDLTAMCYHYYTQPLPNPLSPIFHALPSWFHKLCTLMTFIVEIMVPFLYFGPTWARLVGLIFSMGLLVMINISGNYGFLGLMTAFVTLSLTNDSHWQLLLTPSDITSITFLQHLTGTFGIFVVLLYNFVCLAPLIQSTKYIDPPYFINKCHQMLKPFRVTNYYGKFGSMRTERYELVILASSDGDNWSEIDFKFKPGKLNQQPKWVPLGHLPRLDWRTWFLPSLAARNSEPPDWWNNLLIGILSHNTDILALLDMSSYPFSAKKPPTKLRTAIFIYNFVQPNSSLSVATVADDQKQVEGTTNAGSSIESNKVYWKRELIGFFGNQVTRTDQNVD
ncbi:lipase maturation factor 1-like [Convolutriloba macropyga]|uniref:lipase maturation factor 1-like n=1 Tax=Convolutriloba macropyga TaxID=536237 RepID=UPI003F528665